MILLASWEELCELENESTGGARLEARDSDRVRTWLQSSATKTTEKTGYI